MLKSVREKLLPDRQIRLTQPRDSKWTNRLAWQRANSSSAIWVDIAIPFLCCGLVNANCLIIRSTAAAVAAECQWEAQQHRLHRRPAAGNGGRRGATSSRRPSVRAGAGPGSGSQEAAWEGLRIRGVSLCGVG